MAASSKLLGRHRQRPPRRVAAREQAGDAVRQRPDVQRHHHGGRTLGRRHGGNDGLAGTAQYAERTVAGLLQFAMLADRQARPRTWRRNRPARRARSRGRPRPCARTPAAAFGRPSSQAAAELLFEALEAALGNIGHQRVAIAEVAVGRGRADAGLARGLGEGEPRRALLGNQIERSVDQRFAQVAVMIAAPPAAAVPCQFMGWFLAANGADAHQTTGFVVNRFCAQAAAGTTGR